ncbi:MAG: glycosyltransferase, partial [Chlamydiota bacterium]
PQINTLQNNNLNSSGLSSGIPRLQHSIWVGNPLNADIPKQQKFMNALVKNKRENPNWTVVLWTDQTRETMNNASPDSLPGKMRQWAAENDIVLANIDEVFAGNNKMTLNEISNLEQNKGGTGRAAVSDIARLEILNRFGGMYVDGDKPILVELDEIASAANNNKIRLGIPSGEFQGFAAGNYFGGIQNCALCAQKGHTVTQRILENIRINYRKNREKLEIKGASADKLPRAQR